MSKYTKDEIINYINYLLEGYKEHNLIKYNQKIPLALDLMLYDILNRETVDLVKIENESINIAHKMNKLIENKKIYDRKIKILKIFNENE